MKKILAGGVVALFALGSMATAALAEWKPSGPIKLIIAFKAGGGADTQSRLIAEEIENRKGWKIIPEQATGKGGLNAALALKDQPNDGSAIAMIITETLGYNLAAASNVGLKPGDLTPITTTAGFQMGVVAKSDKGWKTFEDMIAAAKKERLRFGVMSPKLADLAYMIGKANEVEFNIVSVKGGKGVMNGLNGGDLDIGWGAGIQTKAVKAGDMVNLASGLSSKLAISPDAPTMKEIGVDYTADGYFMITGPGGMPQEAREAIASAISEIVLDNSTKANGLITRAFGGPVVIKGAELDTLVSAGYESAGALMKASQ